MSGENEIEQTGPHSATARTNTSKDAAFEAEAWRTGAILFRWQWQGAFGIVAGVLFWFAAVVGCCILVPHSHRYLMLFLLFGGCLAGFVPLGQWMRQSKASLRRLLAAKCPACGGAARFETVRLPDTHVYMVCPECGRRADTGFSVPLNRRTGGRYSMFYNWETQKTTKPGIKR